MTTGNLPTNSSISKEVNDEIQTYFNDYADAFASYDFKAIRNMWSLPCLVTSNKRNLAFSDPTEFLESLTKLGTFGKSVGMTKMQKIVVENCEIAPETVSAITKDTIFNQDGEVIVSWEQTYILQRIDNQWKAIATISTGEVTSWAAMGSKLAVKAASSDNIYID
ncbi:hypothetical protein [Hirschia baltica]|uniref:DUF4440 domain-containing protein n=1 Tax=Hirschia baltica (strain ATCC 49814 / DSM 5838 / IFAM 1418) TaxID=582402 RepID=C6XMC4_HIRBI|nr:hypothetical protein [Hirschia baltica]ACT58067.1 hypothetical protein Hbal_0365 [Hirschia baltica ATCC 49814]